MTYLNTQKLEQLQAAALYHEARQLYELWLGVEWATGKRGVAGRLSCIIHQQHAAFTAAQERRLRCGEDWQLRSE